MRNPVDAVIGLLDRDGFAEAAQQLRDADPGADVSTAIVDILTQIDAVLYEDPDVGQLRIRRLSNSFDVVPLP
jgi:hypothetical protein